MRAYALVGRAAADFATLEFHLQFLTSFLIGGKAVSPEALVLTRRHTFADKIQTIRDLLPFRFPNDGSLRERVLELLSDLDGLRERRNFFVHGYWLINWQLIASEGFIRCSDPKWRFDKKTQTWNSMRSHDIRFEELEELIRRVVKATMEVHSILNELEKGLTQSTGGEQSPPAYPEGRVDAPSGSAEA